MSSTIITDYVGRGTHAARPVSPPISSGAGAFYYETDTNTSFTWTGSAWIGFASGTVTSVTMTVPGELSLTGSPITSSGTFALSWSNETGNVVLASPSGGGSGTPGFRNLVPGDIPNLDTSKITTGTLSLAQLSGITTTQLSATAGIVAGQIASINPSVLTGSGTVPLTALTGITTTQLSSTAGIVAGQIASIPNQNASIITAGTLATARGGTGVDSSTASNGQLLIGTGSGLSLATLTAGSNVTITNASGAITIASTGGGGGSGAKTVVQTSTNLNIAAGNTIVIVNGASLSITLPSAAANAGMEIDIIPGVGGSCNVFASGGDSIVADSTTRSQPYGQGAGTSSWFSDGITTWFFTVN